MKDLIIELFHEALESTNSEILGELKEETVLLESGLDSLGFAILVARLEEETGIDPFAELEEGVYPKTFADFVAIYQS